jgi:peptide/nickel transport system permease protein
MPWLARRIVRSLLLAWAVASVVILATRLVPGDQAGSQSVRYVGDLARLMIGDLGRSLLDGHSVSGEIGRRLPLTLELIACAGLLAMATGIPAGVFAAVSRRASLERIATGLSDLALAVPAFVVGTLLILWFGAPSAAQLALPAISLALGVAAMTYRVAHAVIADVMRRDFVRAARAKGLGRGHILLRHVLPSALAPMLTALTPCLALLLGGAVLVEAVFGYPGMFALLIGAAKARDYPTVSGVVLVGSLLLILLNLAVDLLGSMLDPRIRTT